MIERTARESYKMLSDWMHSEGELTARRIGNRVGFLIPEDEGLFADELIEGAAFLNEPTELEEKDV